MATPANSKRRPGRVCACVDLRHVELNLKQRADGPSQWARVISKRTHTYTIINRLILAAG